MSNFFVLKGDAAPGEGVVYDQTHSSLSSGLTTMTGRFASLDLNLPGVEGVLVDMATKCQTARDIAADRKDRESAKYKERLAEIKGRWQPLEDGFEALFITLKQEANAVLRRRQEETEIARREAEEKLAEARRVEQEAAKPISEAITADSSLPPEAAQAHQDALQTLRTAQTALASLPPAGAPLGVRTKSGTIFTRTYTKWRIEDLSKVPDEYTHRVVNPEKVESAIAAAKAAGQPCVGSEFIPGIVVYEESGMASRRRRKNVR